MTVWGWEDLGPRESTWEAQFMLWRKREGESKKRWLLLKSGFELRSWGLQAKPLSTLPRPTHVKGMQAEVDNIWFTRVMENNGKNNKRRGESPTSKFRTHAIVNTRAPPWPTVLRSDPRIVAPKMKYIISPFPFLN